MVRLAQLEALLQSPPWATASDVAAAASVAAAERVESAWRTAQPGLKEQAREAAAEHVAALKQSQDAVKVWHPLAPTTAAAAASAP